MFSNQPHIDISQLSFDCTKVQGSTATSSSLSLTCPCPDNLVFNKATLSCSSSPCVLTSVDQTCSCPANFMRNQFNLNCVLDCSSIEMALLTPSFGNPSQCYCSYPFIWSNNQCIIDCSVIPFAGQTKGKDMCSCQTGFKWVPETKTCISQPTPEEPAYPVPEEPIIPLPPSPISEPVQPKTVATIVFSILSVILSTPFII